VFNHQNGVWAVVNIRHAGPSADCCGDRQSIEGGRRSAK